MPRSAAIIQCHRIFLINGSFSSLGLRCKQPQKIALELACNLAPFSEAEEFRVAFIRSGAPGKGAVAFGHTTDCGEFSLKGGVNFCPDIVVILIGGKNNVAVCATGYLRCGGFKTHRVPNKAVGTSPFI